MGEPGLNFPADARLAPQFGGLLRARWLRVVLKPHVDLTPWIEDAHRRGMKVLGVIANESLFIDGEPMSSVAAARFYRARYGSLLDKLQVGNEPDHVSPSSWTMSPGVLNHFMGVFKAEFHDTVIVCGGMADGRPEYLDDLNPSLYDEVGVQPYGQRPNDDEDWSETPGNFGNVQELLPRYVAHSGGKKVAVTEIGLSTREVSEAFQARYVEAMVITLLGLSYCTMAIVFCADDLMVPEFGLYGDHDNPKPSAAAFMRAASTYTEPDPMPTQKAIDVSSHQPRDLSGIIAENQPAHVIVKLYMPWENISFDHTAGQVASAKANGCTVGGYVWAYRSADPIATIDAVIDRCASIGLVLPLLWIDCETYGKPVTDPGPDAEWLARAVDHSERHYGMNVGLYTGLWWIRGYFPGGEAGFADFSRLPIWLSQYDHNPDISTTRLPQGWSYAGAKQYSADGIDLNSIRPEHTVVAGGEPPPPPPPPPPDDCKEIKDQLTAWRDRKPYKAPTRKQIAALLP